MDEAVAERWTVDELAAVTGLTVRTTRYYAGLGLLPPPERRGRLAYYGPAHRARLELIRSLQEHGFTLSAIERFLRQLPAEASAEELALQRVLLTAWAPGRQRSRTREELDEAAGRRLTAAQVDLLVSVGAVRPQGERWQLLPTFGACVEMLDLDIPVESMREAGAAISRHMEALADELTEIMRARVVASYRSAEQDSRDPARLEQTVSRLRRLTLEAIVTGFQAAADDVIDRVIRR